MTCCFMTLSTIFQLYRPKEAVIMVMGDVVRWNPVYVDKKVSFDRIGN